LALSIVSVVIRNTHAVAEKKASAKSRRESGRIAVTGQGAQFSDAFAHCMTL